MRAIQAFLLVAVVTVPATAQQRVVRGAHTTTDPAIRLWVPAGMVEVETWDRDSIAVRATPAAGTRLVGGGSGGSHKFALERLDPGDTVLASAQLRVFVPRRARLWIKSTIATVHVRGTGNQLDVLQVGGATTVRDASGSVTLESIDGAIAVGGVDGALRIRSGGGAVSIGPVTGTLEATAVSGAVTVSLTGRHPEAAAAVSGRIETVGGRIWLVGALAPASRLELVTHDGPIDLSLMRDAPPRIENHVTRDGLPPSPVAPAPDAGLVILRSFKGRVSVNYAGGIQSVNPSRRSP